jgi:beta-lactamase superfamily II metal-dependent hydrolase
MTDLPELLILDVGHGNSAVIMDQAGVTVIDCAPGSILLEVLNKLNVEDISNVLISHADYDHIGGLAALLQNDRLTIHNVYLNPDPDRDSSAWRDLRYAVHDARKRGSTVVHTALTSAQSSELRVGEVEVEVLLPHPETAMSGVSGTGLNGKALSPNSMSVVVGVIHGSYRVAILTGDADEVGLRALLAEQPNLPAKFLVFPHHGGRMKNVESEAFATALCNSVKPEVVIFSVGRGRYSNPRGETIKGVRASVPLAHIICTQLSTNCAVNVPLSQSPHSGSLPALGLESKSCCGGTIEISMNADKSSYSPPPGSHKKFITAEVGTPLCGQAYPSSQGDEAKTA